MTGTLLTPVNELTADDAREIAAAWLADFATAVDSALMSDLESLFTDDATWRDFMAFAWDFSPTAPSSRSSTSRR